MSDGLKNRLTKTNEGEAKYLISQVINAIESGKKIEDGRGVVYQQYFGIEFLKALKACRDKLKYPGGMPGNKRTYRKAVRKPR